MNRGSPNTNSFGRWDSFDGTPISGSLIMNHNTGSPKNVTHQARVKYDAFGFK
jgi:hypothetical protein